MDKVLVDTSIWSQVFRRKNPNEQISNELKVLISDLRTVMIGPIRQELLSGIKDDNMFQKLKNVLSVFDDEAILPDDYIRAASLSNTCRRNGVQGSPVDFLICAVAIRCDYCIFTSDNDFELYSKHIPIRLY